MQRFTRIICLLFFVSWFFVVASIFTYEAKAQSEMESFFIESSYDLLGRKEIEAQLVRADNRVYFYIEKGWWNGHSSREQNDLRIALFELGQEFQDRIYPVLTSTFGVEPRPGIDGDERITILIHQMAGEAGGYFRSNDVYEKAVSPTSNEREMVYLNSEYIGKIEAKSFLAHEFTHLITINQKDLLRRVAEETWLNEARAEYAPTLLGYDDVYEGSNLQRRVRNFLENPTDSLTEWLNTKEDYGVINMFVQYLVDHYGKDVLIDSLKSPQVGIASLDEALRRNGFKEDFAQVFEDWAITVLVMFLHIIQLLLGAQTGIVSLAVGRTLLWNLREPVW
ncbi:MAG: Peptidase M6 immune inhibitor A [Parcubacteria group bacterium GW2011_GWA2_50_10]|nr:MAG: Peptidase M6 immune inhibitor A [Parcubacteria group bacterium GW2011_GWA2_50_10]